MPTGIFHQIMNDYQFITCQFFSFCDFDTVVAVGQTCRRLKHCSEKVLDNMADEVVSRRIHSQYSNNSDGKTIASGCYYCDNNAVSIDGELRCGWTEKFSSKHSLIKEALKNCYINSMDEDLVHYDENLAYCLLQTKSAVDIVDFVYNEEDIKQFDEYGWGIKIQQQHLTLADAAEEISYAIWHMKSGVKDMKLQLRDLDNNLSNLWHYAFCLLRKADGASIQFSKLEVEHRAPAYGSSSTAWTVQFLLTGDKQFEFYYSFKYHDL